MPQERKWPWILLGVGSLGVIWLFASTAKASMEEGVGEVEEEVEDAAGS